MEKESKTSGKSFWKKGLFKRVQQQEEELKPYLAPCRQCHKEVSSEAKTCPHCGCSEPIKEWWEAQRRKAEEESYKKQCQNAIGCGTIILLIIIFIATCSIKEGRKEHQQTQQKETQLTQIDQEVAKSFLQASANVKDIKIESKLIADSVVVICSVIFEPQVLDFAAKAYVKEVCEQLANLYSRVGIVGEVTVLGYKGVITIATAEYSGLTGRIVVK